MSSVFQRVRGVFRRKRRPPPSSPRQNTRQIVNPIIRSSTNLSEDRYDIDDDDIENDNTPQQRRLRRQPRTRTPLDENPSSSTFNPSNSELRNVSNVPLPLNTNTNINPAGNVNTTPITQANVLNQPQSQNPSSTPQRSSNNNIIPTQRPIRNNRNLTLAGFPLRSTHQPRSQFGNISFPSHHPFNSRLLTFRPSTGIHNFEFDYPIDDVLIDENIPSSIAIKVNETVEHDRFGNMYYTHRYIYEPSIQQLTVSNNQQIQRRLLGRSYHKGMRYIREINEPNFGNIQLPINPQYNLCYPSSTPIIHHFTACALPNDPMRNY